MWNLQTGSTLPWASFVGFEEVDALAGALAAATAATGARPQSPADVVAERDALKAQLEGLMGTPTQAAITPMAPAPPIMDPALPTAKPPGRGAARIFDDAPGTSFKR